MLSSENGEIRTKGPVESDLRPLRDPISAQIGPNYLAIGEHCRNADWKSATDGPLGRFRRCWPKAKNWRQQLLSSEWLKSGPPGRTKAALGRYGIQFRPLWGRTIRIKDPGDLKNRSGPIYQDRRSCNRSLLDKVENNSDQRSENLSHSGFSWINSDRRSEFCPIPAFIAGFNFDRRSKNY